MRGDRPVISTTCLLDCSNRLQAAVPTCTWTLSFNCKHGQHPVSHLSLRLPPACAFKLLNATQSAAVYTIATQLTLALQKGKEATAYKRRPSS